MSNPYAMLHRTFTTEVESEPVGAEDYYEEGMQLKLEDQLSGAAKRFKDAAELGHAGALVQLGHFHINGSGGVSQDAGQAFYSFQLAAEKKTP